MNRPTISLCCILKNELNNLSQMLASMKGCFDEIHLTDTGSTDGSIELIKGWVGGPNPADSKIYLHHFDWVDDFAAARNTSFSHATTDYIMWLDLDDVLSSADKFIQWRDSVMKLGDFWIATYHYATDITGKPVCSFARERVVKRELDLKWKYFVHEGMIPLSAKKRDVSIQFATPWNVLHKRTPDDMVKDRSRNLLIFEKKKQELDARGLYYYGKELFENNKPLEAFGVLVDAIALPDLEPHDRVMGIQYACLSAMQLNQFDRAIQLAHQGLQLEPLRAEYHVVIGDSYLKLGKLEAAVTEYVAATQCPFNGGGMYSQAIFAHEDSYKHYPLNQIARIYANIGQIDKAEEFVNKAIAYGANVESVGILQEITKIKQAAAVGIVAEKKDTEEIVISCHPNGFYEWDEEIYHQKGIGGSETAVVEMAQHLSKLTNRKVLVFNNRDTAKVFGDVSYLPAKQLPMYFAHHKPKVHIAWRHNIKFTDAPTYIWCHDLGVPGLDNSSHYDKVLALSDFHRDYLVNMFGAPKEKVWVTGNGINPARFSSEKPFKTYGKVVFSSSPDRGLEKAIRVMDLVTKVVPEATLHVYYGFDNMRKNGKGEQADYLTRMALERPWVKLHGNTEQSKLTKELEAACVWLYPADFLETYCITAIEMLCCKVYPVVRNWGALPDTLKGAHCSILDTEQESEYASHVIDALMQHKWEKIEAKPEDYSWEKVAKTWVEFMRL